MLAKARSVSRLSGKLALLVVSLLLVGVVTDRTLADTPQHVIEISVDGLGAVYLQPLIDKNQLPHLKRFQKEGVWTNNARDDFDITVTLPNHVSMLTARSIASLEGHHWTGNGDPGPGQSLHSNVGHYLASVFDVAHDHGLRTGLFASKSKFSLFEVSYAAGRPGKGRIGSDTHHGKIDTYVCQGDTAALVKRFVAEMTKNPLHYSFVHFNNPDAAGHGSGWGSPTYNDSIRYVDGHLGAIFHLIETVPALHGKTTIILTADHGGIGTGHSDASNPAVYTIPFYVWGPHAVAVGDLYSLNTATRSDPGKARPSYSDPRQPIRHGDGANLALELLGLEPVPGSTINPWQDLSLDGRSNQTTDHR